MAILGEVGCDRIGDLRDAGGVISERGWRKGKEEDNADTCNGEEQVDGPSMQAEVKLEIGGWRTQVELHGGQLNGRAELAPGGDDDADRRSHKQHGSPDRETAPEALAASPKLWLPKKSGSNPIQEGTIAPPTCHTLLPVVLYLPIRSS